MYIKIAQLLKMTFKSSEFRKNGETAPPEKEDI